MEEKLVSIITAMWKGASLVGKTIDSVVSQSYKNWEMIIVDDSSPDDGAGCKVVQSYAEKDNRIHLICSKENRGSSGASKTISRKTAWFPKNSRRTLYIYIIEEF